ncbi:MAG: Ku protein [Gemmatimonadota bacterium]|nr:Ku protein [Gemmatimonadota bacterium]
MSARPISTATVAFGLVSVPVKLYSASEATAKVTFNWLHKDCGSRLRQQYVCKVHGEVVERDDMVKGYEFAKDQYVLFSPDELKALEEKSTESIEITEFVPAEQVSRQFLSKVYYLGPDKGGERAYRLLSRALQDTGLSALAKYSARGKQHLVMVRPMGEGLAMEQLLYPDEIRSFDEVPLGEGAVKDEELALAKQLIEQAAAKAFEPEKYEDEVRKRLLEQIERKIAGQEITAAPAEEPQTQIIDLMEALKASLAKSQDDAAAKGKRVRKPSDKTKTASKRKRAGETS